MSKVVPLCPACQFVFLRITSDQVGLKLQYNFPQGRVTDHRIKLTLYKIDAIMDGDLQELIDSLIAADQAAKLAKMNEN